jgi:carbamoyltransferase
MNILGLIYYEDFGQPAACLLQEGQLMAWAEEERFVRVKQAKGYFPGQAIRYCLQAGGITFDDIDEIAYGWDATRYRWQYPLHLGRSFLRDRLRYRASRVSDPVLRRRPPLGSAVSSGLRDLLGMQPGHLTQQLHMGLRQAGFTTANYPPIHFVGHHHAHAATAFYHSGFEQSAVLVYDGHGEEKTISMWRGEGQGLTLLHQQKIPHSLGWFYSMFTEYLGWSPNEGEVKLMGLAPYGGPDPAIAAVVADVLQLRPQGIALNPAFSFYQNRSYGQFFSDLLVEKLGLPRGQYEPITDRHRAIAWAVQQRLELAGAHLARLALQKAGSRRLCLSGGVALNCKLNGQLAQLPEVEQLFVQPVSHDAGVSLGAAMVRAQAQGADPRHKLEHLHWGPAFTDEEIEAVLQRNGIRYVRLSEAERPQRVARLLAAGKLVGWFQGRMEIGPRALGGRSILADPRSAASAHQVNARVKFRENWRPFALSVLAEEAPRLFAAPHKAPFMTTAHAVLPQALPQLQGGLHQGDGTTRPQTVRREVHPAFYAVIKAFHAETGVPAVLNTSFNVKGEPIVCTPEDALRCFFGTGLHGLALGGFWVEKER